ncbi:MAG TPA: ABC transporter substrate-binding protein [Acidiphilium sp.]
MLVGTGAALGLGLLPPFARAAGTETVTLRLDWTPWGEQAAYHLAKVKGWYKQAGLDVHIQDGNGSTSTVQIVANDGDVDVGDAALSSMMVGRGKGEDIKAVACYARNGDAGLLIPKDSPIKSVADLRGKKLGYTASSLEGPFLNMFLAKGGLKPGDCDLVNLNGGAKIAAYVTGRLDGAFSAVGFFLPVVNEKRPSRALLFGDVGLRVPSYGLFATGKKIADRNDALKRLVSVSSGAWAYIAAGHEAEGVAAIRHERPRAPLSDAIMLAQIKLFLSFFNTPATRGRPVGWMAGSDWAAAVETMTDVKMIKPGTNPDSFYTNALLDDALYGKVARL